MKRPQSVRGAHPAILASYLARVVNIKPESRMWHRLEALQESVMLRDESPGTSLGFWSFAIHRIHVKVKLLSNHSHTDFSQGLELLELPHKDRQKVAEPMSCHDPEIATWNISHVRMQVILAYLPNSHGHLLNGVLAIGLSRYRKFP